MEFECDVIYNATDTWTGLSCVGSTGFDYDFILTGFVGLFFLLSVILALIAFGKK